jgi:hypothetical protein
MVNYNSGKVYKIQPIMEHDENDIYIRSTTKQYLSQRMENHRSKYKLWKKGKGTKYMCYELFNKYGIENCQILLIENVHANSEDELVSREGYYIRNMKCINKNIPDRTKKEYYINNKEIIKEYKHKYYINNKEIIKEKQSKKHFCECGIHYTENNKSNHFKTLKHQTRMELIDKINDIIKKFHHQHYHLHQI